MNILENDAKTSINLSPDGATVRIEMKSGPISFIIPTEEMDKLCENWQYLRKYYTEASGTWGQEYASVAGHLKDSVALGEKLGA